MNDGAVGEAQPVGDDGDRAVRVDALERRGPRRGAGHEVESEVTDEDVPGLVDDEVVEVPAAVLGQIDQLVEPAVGQPQQPVVLHRDDDERAVR